MPALPPVTKMTFLGMLARIMAGVVILGEAAFVAWYQLGKFENELWIHRRLAPRWME
jgi:hypothetical protein